MARIDVMELLTKHKFNFQDGLTMSRTTVW